MEITKALTFRASSIGDCLMGKYFLENVRARHPSARCGIVVGSRGAMIRDLLAAYPWIEVVEANRRDPLSILRLMKQWRGSDIVLTQYAGKPGGRFSLGSKVVARLLARSGGLIGFIDISPVNSHLYDALVPFEGQMAPAELERQALSTMNIPITFLTPTLTFLPQESVLKRVGVEANRYVVVHLFAGNAGRGLSPENRKKLLALLHEHMPLTTLLVTGGKQDREEAQAAAEGSGAHVIAGDASLQEMMQLISSSAGVVSLDTGMAHITAQLGKPVVVLATCLGLHWWGEGQYGKERPISLYSRAELCARGHTAKAYPECMNAIDLNAVAEKVKEFI